jgi:Fe-Mn family superoxide dismutase
MFDIKDYPLPFAPESLAPYMSADTIGLHHGKHLAAYISNLNALAKGTPFEYITLEKIIVEAAKSADSQGIFNNAAQIFNHNFFFRGLKKDDANAFPKKLEAAFGSKDRFSDAFKSVANSVFGSGWVWLVRDGKELKIVKTVNAGTPVAHGMAPVLALDLWEHAYYLDYQNRRADFIDAFLARMINWRSVESRL